MLIILNADRSNHETYRATCFIEIEMYLSDMLPIK